MGKCPDHLKSTSPMAIWKSIEDRNAGYLFSLSDSLTILERHKPDSLVSVTDGTMIIVSDYSGQHKQATHEAYSFLITTDQALAEWLPTLETFRAQCLPDNRRMSFKKLSEPLRWRALRPFLATASALRGNLLTILVDRKVGSFILGGPKAAIDIFPDCFSSNTKHGTVEKMLRIASFISMIKFGLRLETQRSNWISDHDEALDTYERREQFARLATYLTFGLTGWRNAAESLFGTTESPLSPKWAEDIAAIPDLVAGACCRLTSLLPAYVGTEVWTKTVSTTGMEDKRALVVGDWMATRKGSLHHILIRLEADKNDFVRASAQSFVCPQ